MEVGWRISYHPKRSPSQVEDDIVSALWKHRGNTHLVTKGVSTIQICLEKLLEAGYIEWKGSLRKTYLHYLEPKRLDLTTKEMYHHLNQGDVLNAFQFDSQSGEAILAKTKPETLLEVATANTLMRLMVEEEGLEQPSDLYVRYKADINEWDKDMRDFGLNGDEVRILKDHLLSDYGVMNTQEQMMKMVMDDRVSNFDVVASNGLRRAVAKKKGKLYDQSQEKFYRDGLANGCRKVFLDYIWHRQIAMQKG